MNTHSNYKISKLLSRWNQLFAIVLYLAGLISVVNVLHGLVLR